MKSRLAYLWSLLPVLALALGLGSARAPHADPLPEGVETVKAFAKEYGFNRIEVTGKTVRLKGGLHELVLYKDSRRAVLNGSMLWLNQPMKVNRGLWTLDGEDVAKTLAPLVRPGEALGGLGHRVVVLDPGHGGGDGGALSPAGLKEKDVVLDIAKRVRAHLKTLGYTVYMTRFDDRFLTLGERPRRAAAWKADAFVSIHANSGAQTAKGTETFVLALPGGHSTNHISARRAPAEVFDGNEHDEGNMALAFALHHALLGGNTLTDRGVRRARFAVLKDAPCPAALVEVGFLSHAEEGLELARAAHREQLAKSLAGGIDIYMRAVKNAALRAVTQSEE